MKRLVILVLACSAIALSFSAIAAAQRGEPTVILHADETKKADRCIPVTEGLEGNADCSLVNTEQSTLGSYFVYVLFGAQGLNGIGGGELSINYDEGITVHQWSKCAPLEFRGQDPAWPATGSSNSITWGGGEACATNSLNIGGYFEMTAYAAGRMWVSVASSGNLAVTDCNIATSILDPVADAGVAAFGGSDSGCNPCVTMCEGVPTLETTWGKLKNLYSDSE